MMMMVVVVVVVMPIALLLLLLLSKCNQTLSLSWLDFSFLLIIISIHVTFIHSAADIGLDITSKGHDDISLWIDESQMEQFGSVDF